MEFALLHKFPDFASKLRKRLNRNFFIFLIFLFLSGLFWLLNELGKETISDISYPVRYTNLPANTILANDIPRRLTLKLKASGYSMLRFKLSSGLIPLNLDLESYFMRQLPGMRSSEYYLLTDELRARFERRLTSDISIIDIQPDSLFFSFDSIVSRKIKVNPDVEFSLARQYMLMDGFRTNPDSILVYGPEIILDSLSFVSTRKLSFEELSSSVEEEVELVQIPKIEFDREKVMVLAGVEQFTEANLKVPIETINVPDSLVLKTFPNNVSLSCISGLSDYDKVSAHVFMLEVDYLEIDQILGGKLKVKIASAPDFVSSVRIHPIYVEFIIEKK